MKELKYLTTAFKIIETKLVIVGDGPEKTD